MSLYTARPLLNGPADTPPTVFIERTEYGGDQLPKTKVLGTTDPARAVFFALRLIQSAMEADHKQACLGLRDAMNVCSDQSDSLYQFAEAVLERVTAVRQRAVS